MNRAVGEMLPLALGVAVSPIPVVAVLLVLRGARAKTAGPAFALGWAAGVAAAVMAFSLAGALLPDEGSGGSRPIGGAIRIILGGLLGLLAARQWSLRPRGGAEPRPPSWLSSVSQLQPWRAAGLGLLLAVATPKNLVLTADAGLASEGSTGEQRVLFVLLFTLLASLPLALIVYLFRPRDWQIGTEEDARLIEEHEARVSERLDRARRWLLLHEAGVVTVLLAVLAFNLVGSGIAAF